MLDSDKPGSSVVEIQCLLDNVGASELVIDLIVNTKNDRVFEESILLGIALLQGGNTQIQVGGTDTHILLFPSTLISYDPEHTHRQIQTYVDDASASHPELLL